MGHLSKLLISTFLLPLPLFADERELSSNPSSETGFIDKTYHYLNDTFCRPAIWFDSFFVDEGVSSDAHAETMIRWYNDLSWSDLEGLEFTSKLNARLRLPRVTRKLKLVFESEDADEPFDLFPRDEKDTQNELGLDYDLYTKRRSSFNIKISFRPSIEGRYIYSYPLTAQTLFRFTQRLYQREKVTGESSQIDLDYSIHPKFLLRWTNFAKFESDIDGFKIGTGLTLFQYISKKQAINYKASIGGPDKPYHYINNSHLSITYRHNILRKWFFYEITPEINWNKTADTARQKEATITLRFEVLFTNV